jgi:hypothetical protein
VLALCIQPYWKGAFMSNIENRLPYIFASVFGILLMVVGFFSVGLLGYLFYYGTSLRYDMALAALVSCLIWVGTYFVFQSIMRAPRSFVAPSTSAIVAQPPSWALTPRNLAAALAIVTGAVFGVLLLLLYNMTLTFLIITPFVLIFPFSYMAYMAFQRSVRIERLRRDFELLTAEWNENILRQSQDPFNYALHIVLAMFATLLGLFILFMPLNLEIDPGIVSATEYYFNGIRVSAVGLTPEVLRAIGFGFLGGFLFSVTQIYRRYTMFDLLPSVYLYCAVAILAGIIFNYFAFTSLLALSETSDGLTGGVLDVLAFSLGFFPLLALQWLSRITYTAFNQTQRRSDLLRLDQIDGLSQSHEVRLRDEAIDDAQNLASADIPTLLISTRFSVQTVIDWVDQAILLVLLNDSAALDSFRKARVRTMTDFRDLWGPDHEELRVLNRQLADENNEAVRGRLGARIDELMANQTQTATELNSNVALLNSLYVSTNFDMNIHYLENYRHNVLLLLPGWTSARYNRYLIDAFRLEHDPHNPYYKAREMARLWQSVRQYLQEVERSDRNAEVRDRIVPLTAEARAGYARLLVYCTDMDAITVFEREFKAALDANDGTKAKAAMDKLHKSTISATAIEEFTRADEMNADALERIAIIRQPDHDHDERIERAIKEAKEKAAERGVALA